MAASIAYHASVSILPILLLLTLGMSAFGGGEFVTTVLEITAIFLPEATQQVVADALRSATDRLGVSVVSVGLLLWGTSTIFRTMDAAFAQIYDTERKLSLADQVRDAVLVGVALTAAAAVAALLSPVITVPVTVPFSFVFDGLVAVLGLTVAFFPVYYVFPNVEVSVREVLPGVLVAAVGWAGLEWLFHFYASVSNKPDIYGLLGTQLLLVVWLYVGSLVLLVGAAVNATLAGRDGDSTTQRRGRRQFGRGVVDEDSFEEGLDKLVRQARDADVPGDEIRRTLEERTERVGESEDSQSADAAAPADDASGSR